MNEPVTNVRRMKTPSRPVLESVIPDEFVKPEVLDETSFLRMLCLERKRTERSSRRFVLMLLEAGSLLKKGKTDRPLEKILTTLSHSTRDTDVKGWYKDAEILGVIFTELGDAEGRVVANALLTRLTGALCGTLSIEEINSIRLSFHVYPEDFGNPGSGGPSDLVLYPDVVSALDKKNGSRLLKRSIDIIGSLVGLTLFSPVLLTIAVAVKITSKGPILFRQQRVGQYGHRFTFLKFRSMHTGNDNRIHQEFVTKLIKGKSGSEPGSDKQVYKIVNDPRITRIGRFLRRTSLDELPQFLNVLAGDMSLVGPRPPIPYEFACYAPWQRHRLLSVKPGITGLWQVEGRSRVSFNDMVRLDLKYARTCSFWMDLKILLRTPQAVLSGEGAH